MSWVPVLLVALGGFFGAGSVSLWRTDHRGAAVLMAIIGAAFLAGGILWLIPAQ